MSGGLLMKEGVAGGEVMRVVDFRVNRNGEEDERRERCAVGIGERCSSLRKTKNNRGYGGRRR